MTPDSDQQAKRVGLTLPWGWLSLSLLIITIAALGTLAVVARKQSADSLSTIALALAILSFSAQLIVTLAQSYNGTQQLSQADQVNAETKSSLAAIRATSDALLATQRDQFAQVLHAALKIAIPAAVEDVADSEIDSNGNESSSTFDEQAAALESRLLVRIDEALANKAQNAERVPVNSTSSRMHRLAEEQYNKLTTFPSEKEGETSLKILRSLTPLEAAEFGKIATQMANELRQRARSKLYKRGDISDAEHRLKASGLIDVSTIKAGTSSAERRIGLTPLGRDAASLIVGKHPMPDWLRLPDAQLEKPLLKLIRCNA